MRLFESEKEKANRLVADEVYIKIPFNFEDSLDLKETLVDHFSTFYYDECLDGDDNDNYSSCEEYIKYRMENLTDKDVVDMFQHMYCSKSEMIRDFMETHISEEDVAFDVSIDNDEEDEEWDDEEEEDEWGCDDDLEEEFVGGITEEISTESIAPLDSITSKIREAA